MGRPVQWNEQDSEYLTYLVENTKMTNAEIAEEMGKQTASISLYKAKLGLINKFKGSTCKYSDEELLDMLKQRGYCQRREWDAEDHPVTSNVYNSRFGGFTKALLMLGLVKKEFQDHELLQILRKAESTSVNTWKATAYIPCAKVFKDRFGSWSNALELAGIRNTAGILQNKTTYVYIVKFNQSNIYKIGITQRDVEQRLQGFPAFETIVLLSLPEYKSAKAIETEWLNNVKHLSFTEEIPNGFGKAGYTECFTFE